MPVASESARTRFGLGGGIARRAGSFAGKEEAAPDTFVAYQTIELGPIKRTIELGPINRTIELGPINRTIEL